MRFCASLPRMMDALSIAASALKAQATTADVIADNVANAVTPGYTSKQAPLVAMNPGVSVGPIVDSGQSVDLSTELINLIVAQTAYAAAAKVVSTAGRMGRALLAAI
jgi:flagellar hook protein FlgE